MKILTFNVGIIGTNCYLVTDEESGESVLVDPGAMSPRLEEALKETFPIIILEIVVLAIMVLCPPIITFLPNLLM